MLSRLGMELRSDQNRIPRPITRPSINLPPLDDETIAAEARTAAAKIKTIRLGRDAWEQIAKAQSFDGWLVIGAALSIGKRHALKVTGANAAWGRNYSHEFSLWVRQHGFEKTPAATRSVAVELHENAHTIEAWRSTLDERTRRRLVHPLSNVRRWRASAHANGRSPTDLRHAKAAWRRFRSCLEGLPLDQAAPLRQAAQAELATLSP